MLMFELKVDCRLLTSTWLYHCWWSMFFLHLGPGKCGHECKNEHPVSGLTSWDKAGFRGRILKKFMWYFSVLIYLFSSFRSWTHKKTLHSFGHENQSSWLYVFKNLQEVLNGILNETVWLWLIFKLSPD